MFLFACLSAVFTTLLILYYSRTHPLKEELPAPNLTHSISYNEKLEFIRRSKNDTRVVAIGSSMCLNNLYSPAILDKLHIRSYLNASSWGMSMKDTYLLLQMLYETHHPDIILLSSNTIDFQHKDKNANCFFIKHYLVSSDLLSYPYHLINFNLDYYKTNFEYLKEIRTIKTNYTYLKFDPYGTVNLEGKGFKIDPERWDLDFVIPAVPHQYAYFDSISTFCKDRNIALLFFQSPIRKNLFVKLSPQKINLLATHLNKIKTVLSRDQHTFVDANRVLWEDSLFTDAIHFNTQGAKYYTEYCLDEVNRNR
ncbi:MAG: hypothetical protein JWO58_710 [Chitinophagaceae bacterium]|nr:hypothetical protein [Chitinophagaceae bacterium]